MKFFPAEASGGRPYLSAVAGPCPGCGSARPVASRWPTPPDYLALPNVGCVGGSWLTPEGRSGRRGLGAHRGPRPQGRGPARLSARRLAGSRAAARLTAPAPGREQPASSGGGRSAMDESHVLAGCGDCCGLRFTLAVRTGARGHQGIRLASAQPPHTSVGYSLGGPPPFLCTRPYVARRTRQLESPRANTVVVARGTTKRPARRAAEGVAGTGRPRAAPPGGGSGRRHTSGEVRPEGSDGRDDLVVVQAGQAVDTRRTRRACRC